MTGRKPCVLCARPSVDAHHVTQHGIDFELTLPLCHDHHEVVHDDWRGADVAADVAPETLLHALQLGMERLAMIAGRAAATEALEPAREMLAALATWLAKWASRLIGAIAALDAGAPGWREAMQCAFPVFSPSTPDQQQS
jgi:hypothetical protein